MLSALLAGALIVLASLLLGVALMVLAGRPRHSAAGPATGLSALLVICGIAVKLPGHGVSAAIATGLAMIGAIVLLGRSRAPMGSVRPGAMVAVVGAVLVIAIPFATSGRIGILGQGLVNDDMASHLLFTEWVDTHDGPTPDLIKDGYPLGPHAVVAASTKASGADLVEGYAGLTGAIAVLAALTAFGALRGVREPFRSPAAILGAAPYLAAAYLAQGAFKEPMLGLAVLGFALSLPGLRGNWTPRAGIPAGVIAAGTIYNYSFPGLAWLIGTAVIWALIVAIQDRRGRGGFQIGERLRSARPVTAVAIGLPILAAIPEVFRLASFSDFKAFNPQGTGPTVGFGNLRQALNPLEALGIWPSSEFRIAPANSTTPEIAFYLGGLLALAALAWALGRAIARREAALPGALAACAVAYLGALAVGTPYTQAKALAIAAPVAMVIILRGLLSAEALEGEEASDAASSGSRPGAAWPPSFIRPVARFGLPLLAVAFVGAAAVSTLLPLRQSSVGPTNHVDELMRMRPLVDDQKVLFLGRDNFISWELIGSEVYAPIINHYDTEEVASLYRATPINAKFDWDNVPDDVLAHFDWVLTTSADFASEAPPEFAPREISDDFVLWERRPGVETPPSGKPGARRTLLEPLDPGAVLDCSGPDGALEGVAGTATVLRLPPVTGDDWSPDDEPTESSPATQELDLGPGRWRIAIQYASTQEMHISAPGLELTMRTNLLFRGPSPYYPVGEVDVKESGPVSFSVTVDRPPAIGRLLGTEGRAYLGRIAATPISAGQPAGPGEAPATSRARIPLGSACGSYVDWYQLAPGTPPAAVAAVGAPTPQAVEPDD